MALLLYKSKAGRGVGRVITPPDINHMKSLNNVHERVKNLISDQAATHILDESKERPINTLKKVRGGNRSHSSRSFAALRISSSEILERSHIPRKIPSSTSNNLVGVSNSAIRPASMTQILS